MVQNRPRDIFSRCKLEREIFSPIPPGAERLPPGGPRGARAPLGQKYPQIDFLFISFFPLSLLSPLGGLIIQPAGAIKPLINMLSSGVVTSRTVAAHVLGSLALDSAVKAAVIEAGAIEHLVLQAAADDPNERVVAEHSLFILRTHAPHTVKFP